MITVSLEQYVPYNGSYNRFNSSKNLPLHRINNLHDDKRRF